MPSAALRRPGALITPAEYRGMMGKVPNTRAPLLDTRALGRLPAGDMNQTEARYDALLWERRARGEVVWHKFEGMTFKLADDTRYTPDFPLMLASGEIEIHEVKGFWREDGRIKIKVAASLFPFQFIAVQWKGGRWVEERF